MLQCGHVSSLPVKYMISTSILILYSIVWEKAIVHIKDSSSFFLLCMEKISNSQSIMMIMIRYWNAVEIAVQVSWTIIIYMKKNYRKRTQKTYITHQFQFHCLRVSGEKSGIIIRERDRENWSVILTLSLDFFIAKAHKL